MRLERLNPEQHEAIYKTLYDANKNTPPWYQASDAAWGIDDWDDFDQRKERTDLIDCAVYEGDQLQGSITVIEIAPKIWETFVLGVRHSDANCLTQACFGMAKDLMDAGLAESFVSWVCTLNRGALKLNRNAGMIETGIQLYKGSYKGRPLKFIHFAMDKARVNGLWNGEEQEQANLATK